MDKFGSAVAKKLKGKKSNPNNNSGGESFEQLVKDATQKHLKTPDSILNQKVVELLPATINAEGAPAVVSALTERLSQKNPHKVFLAICLIKEVLRRCQSELGPAKEDIMAEVGKVASAPMNRFDSNLSDQQRTKTAAFEMLKTYGQDGHLLSQPQPSYQQPARGQGPSPRAQGNHGVEGGNQQSLPDLLDTIQTQTMVAASHNDLLQDMLLDKSSYESKTPQDRALAKDVIMDATKFGQQFEQQLGRLSAYDSPDAVAAMTQALEKMDVLNNSLNLHKEMLQKQLKGAMARPSRGNNPASPRRTTSAGSAGSQPSRPQQSPALGTLLELQQGLEAPYQHSQPPARDPFAASTQWQPPGSQPHQQPPQQNAQHQQQQQHMQPQGSLNSQGSWGGQPGQGGPPGAGGYGQGFPHPPQNPAYNPYAQGYGGQNPQYGGYPMGPQTWGGPQSSHPHGYYMPGPQAWGGPPSSQGYGQHQAWGGPQSSGQGYGQPQGYGFANFAPPGQHRPQDGGYGQRPPAQQYQGPSPQVSQPSVHVPPPMTEATVYVPAKTDPAQSTDSKQPKADSAVQPSKPGALSVQGPNAASPPARPQTPTSSSDTFSKASPLPSPSLDQTTAAGNSAPKDDFNFESNAFSKPPTAAPTPSPAPPPSGSAASEFAFESSAFAPVPTSTPQAANPAKSAPPSSFQLKPEPSKGASVPVEAFPLPPVTATAQQQPTAMDEPKSSVPFEAFPPPTAAATAQSQPPASAKAKDDDWDLFFTEDKSSGTVTQAGAEKTPVDLMADAFKEMQTKQKA